MASGVRRQASAPRDVDGDASTSSYELRARFFCFLLPSSSFEGVIGSPYAIVDVEMSLDIGAWMR